VLFPERLITAEHVRAFCSKFNEGYRVEYKRAFDASVRDKIPKVLSSFANSRGGALVVGVDAVNGVPQPPFQGFQPRSRR
jgi:predicted HTH transcriptional regulator